MKRLNSKKQKSLRGSKGQQSGGGRMKGELSRWCLDDVLVLSLGCTPYSFFIVRGRYTFDCFSHHFGELCVTNGHILGLLFELFPFFVIVRLSGYLLRRDFAHHLPFATRLLIVMCCVC